MLIKLAVYYVISLLVFGLWSIFKVGSESDEEMDKALRAHLEAKAYTEALRIKKGE